jgi:4a-hydroxytetrahydrobiopterin dehydratase
MRFVNRVAEVAEAQGHHPDFAIHWNKVELVLWTHSIGGLHENDFIVAARIDRLLEEPSRPSGAVLAG